MTALQKLQHILHVVPGKLQSIPKADFDIKPAAGKWSKKEIIGHLTDSAANNHHRFIRAQYENVPVIFYDQDKWNALNHYNDIDGQQVIALWTAYNKHLAEVIRHIPAENLTRECKADDDKMATLGWLIDDYVAHMEHHLKQIVDY